MHFDWLACRNGAEFSRLGVGEMFGVSITPLRMPGGIAKVVDSCRPVSVGRLAAEFCNSRAADAPLFRYGITSAASGLLLAREVL